MNKFATIYHKLGGLIIVNGLLVLLIEVGEVDNEVLDDKSAREGSDGSGLGSVCVDGLKTSHGVGPIDVHGARSTYPFPT